MTCDELAALLNGRQYQEEETGIDFPDNLLVVFGASDDLVEFRGAVNDEVGAWNGRTIRLSDKLMPIEKRDDEKELIRMGWMPPTALLTVKAEWCPKGFDGSWRMSADKPFATFHIMEDDRLYCEGIVIDIGALKD